MKVRLILSLAMMVFVAGAAAAAGTGAFFSDTETSTGNTFTAGAIDLLVSNESYVTNNDGDLVFSDSTSWQASDLTDQLFFNFLDLKPGDEGEDTIDLTVVNNDAYACMALDITATPENDQTEPEAAVDASTGDDEGELQDELRFVWWADDGDNVFETEENVFAEGLASELFDGSFMTLADSASNVWTGQAGPITGDETYYIAKYWCFGELTKAPLTQDGENDLISPLDGTGFLCNGAPVTNASQTDGMTVDVTFEAIQSRNNDQFLCSGLNPVPAPEVTEGQSWAPNASGQEFFAKAKVQEPNPASDFEVQVGVGDSNPADYDSGDTEYSDNVAAPFTLTFDGVDTATFTANGEVTSYVVGSQDIENIGITIRAPSDATTTVSGLVLSTGALSDTDVSVSDGTAHLYISGASLNGGFTLTGDVTFDWDTLTSNGENQKMQISVN